MPKFRWSLAPVAAFVLVVAASVAGAHAYQLGALHIDHPWTRPTPPSAPTAAGYFVVTNTGSVPDRFLGAVSPLADRIEIHQMSMADGVMRMRPITGGVEIAPGARLSLSPGGLHLMIIGPKRPFKLGESIPATLRFERAGEIKVDFLVQAEPPPGDSMPGMAGMPGMQGMPGMSH